MYYSVKKILPLVGLEPTTVGSKVQRSVLLSYKGLLHSIKGPNRSSKQAVGWGQVPVCTTSVLLNPVVFIGKW